MLRKRWAISLTVVVLPLVPVTAMIGMAASLPGGYSMSSIGAPTLRALPSVGCVCIRMPGAAARILVCRVDQLPNRAPPVADHVRGDTLGARDDLAVDDEHAVIAPLVVVLDDDAIRNRVRRGPRGANSLRVVEGSADAASMTPVHR